jgi:hypothetical protein
LAARAHVLGADNVKTKGVLSSVSGEESLHQTVVIYASEKAHRCVDQVFSRPIVDKWLVF